MDSFQWERCNNCLERFPGLNVDQAGRCRTCKRNPQYLTQHNNMNPGPVPHCFTDLSMIEQLLIARIHPVVSVFRLRSGQLSYSGNVINFPQDVSTFAQTLPHAISDLKGIIIVRRDTAEEGVFRDFHVRAQRVKEALVYLRLNNPFYSDIQRSQELISLLLDKGNVYNELQHASTLSADTGQEEQHDISEVVYGNAPGYHAPQQAAAVRATIDPDVVTWPVIDSNPVNEFQTEGYIVSAFPALFPTGKCDLRDRSRPFKISPDTYFKHLMRYDDGRFAKDPRFRFFALNSKLRWEAIKLGSLFVRKRHLIGKTAQQLQDLLQQRPNLANEIAYFSSPLRATRAFWYKRCAELKEMITTLGTPTLFFTLSAADLHWPELYHLLAPGELLSDSSASMSHRQQLLNNNIIH